MDDPFPFKRGCSKFRTEQVFTGKAHIGESNIQTDNIGTVDVYLFDDIYYNIIVSSTRDTIGMLHWLLNRKRNSL